MVCLRAFQVSAVALVLISAACADKPAAVTSSQSVQASESAVVKIDQSKSDVRVGEILGLTMKGTTWRFLDSSNPSILRRVTIPGQTVNCAPESGCGVTDAEYKGIAPGTVTVTAVQDICGGHRCVGDENEYRFTVVVYTWSRDPSDP
jgi:hypothetical protein